MGTSALAMAGWNVNIAGADLGVDIEVLYTVVDFNTEDVYRISFGTLNGGQALKLLIVAGLDGVMAVFESVDVNYSITTGGM